MWTLATAALDLLFPAVCPLCASRLGAGRRDPLCGGCWASFERLTPPLCLVCGLPAPLNMGAPQLADPQTASEHGGPTTHRRAVAPEARLCGATDPQPPSSEAAAPCAVCREAPPPYDYARAAASYGGAVREAVHALKFGGRRSVARPLADLLGEQCVALTAVDALVPVPLARARERERGFNQATLLAERLGERLHLRVRPRWLVRLRATAPQSDLTASERRANVAGAFVAAPAVRGRHVVVVDDVVTTGATVGECARALYLAGARRVGVLAVARVL